MVMTLRKRCRSVSSQTNQTGFFSKRHKKVDRISQLPEPILHHIMSFLTTTDVTRSPSKIWNPETTRSVSKTWSTAWNSIPVLEFDQRVFDNFINSSKQKKKVKETSPKKNVDNFCDYVEKSIRRHNSDISLQKFSIAVDLYGRGRDAVPVQDIHRWFNYLKTKNVRTLRFRCLKNSADVDEWRYKLTESLLCSKSLEELDLFGCRFLEDGVKTNSFGFSLRKLSLVHVRVDQISLQSFLSSCCNVEEVCIQYCNQFETVKLAGVKLKKVDFVLSRTKLQTITIEAPSLEYICCSGQWENIKRSLMGSDCKNVKELVVSDSGTMADICQIVSLKFPLTENVVLRKCGPQIKMITSEDLPVERPTMLMSRKFNMLNELY